MDSSLDKQKPTYTISQAATLLHISVHTLRMYEREGLIIPFQKKTKHRLYSKADLERLECIRSAINQLKISINGIKTMYSLIPCWEIMKCSQKERNKCKSYNEHSKPCWTYAHEDSLCQEKNCRDCDVYQKYSQCGQIKELIRCITRL